MHSNKEDVATKLQRIAKKASKDKRCQFTSLFHLMNKELLLECFTQLKGNAASGIDNITKEAYAINLDANLQHLIERLHKMAYKPQPVLRVYIPKPGSKKRTKAVNKSGQKQKGSNLDITQQGAQASCYDKTTENRIRRRLLSCNES